MSMIRIIEEDRAQGLLREVYGRIRAARGGVADVLKVQSLDPAAMHASFELYRTLVFRPGPLERRTREMIGVVVSAANGCDYGVRHHGEALHQLGVPPALVEELAQGEIPDGEMLSAQVQHLLAYARTIARAPGEAAGHVDALREVGWSDEAVLAAALLAAYFGHLNRIVLALGVTLESDFERTCAPELQEEPMPLPWEALR